MNLDPITRRDVLAGIGATGVAAIGGLTFFTEPALATDHTTEGGNGLVLDWAATRNDSDDSSSVTTNETTFTYSPEPVLPGDFGTLAVEIQMTDGNSTDHDARLSLELTETAENGINDPEAEAGDTSPDEGELQDYIQVDIFRDEGTLGVDQWGATNGEQDPGESLLTDSSGDPVEGTLAEVAAQVPDPDPADPESGLLIDSGLDDSNSVAVTFAWAFPGEAGINRTQGDSVEFDLAFTAEDS